MVELVLSRAEAERMEALRSEAWLIRNEICRLVFSDQRARSRSRLGELRGRYFRLLERIDRVKRLWPTLPSESDDFGEAGDESTARTDSGTLH